MNHVNKFDRYHTVVLWDIQVHERKLTPHALFVFSTSEMNDHISSVADCNVYNQTN